MYEPASAEEREYLESYDPSQYPIITVTVDVVLIDTSTDSVLLIRRGNWPYKDYFALPGGFIEPHEKAADAARRELREETGVDVARFEFLALADDPDRDPRGRVISHVFAAHFDSKEIPPMPGDDAVEVRLVPFSDIGNTKIAFDHLRWIAKARKRQALIAELSEGRP